MAWSPLGSLRLLEVRIFDEKIQCDKRKSYLLLVGGGFKYCFDFHPETWGRFPFILTHIFQHGLKPSTRKKEVKENGGKKKWKWHG